MPPRKAIKRAAQTTSVKPSKSKQKTKQEPVPPRKATKRTAQASSAEPSKAKQKRKQEPVLTLKPNLYQSTTGGEILTVGQGDVGQLGLGVDVMEKARPAVVPGFQDIVAIAAGGMHNVCLRKTGEVITFGCNDEGALGRDTSKEGSETIPGAVELPGKVIQVTAGDSHSAALLEDGRVFAWGSFRDSHGTMGLTERGNERFPVELLPNIKIVKVASGADHLVLLSTSGHVYTCGCAEQGQLGRISPRSGNRYTRRGMLPLLTPGLVQFPITKKVEIGDIWAGTYCTFLKEFNKGDIYVFGLNNYFQIGLSDPTTYFHPEISKTFHGKVWRHISSGQHHTIALDESGQVYVLGRKEYGRLGLGPNGSDATKLTPVPLLNSIKCIHVAAGAAQSFAATELGELYAWGMGTCGQLGTGNEKDVEEPTLIKSKQLKDRKVVQVAGGGQHSLILAIASMEDETKECVITSTM